MPTTLETAVAEYLRSGNPAQRTREEYSTTPRKWARWGGGVPLDRLGRKELREFLDWVYEDAAERNGGNPGRTANKVRSHPLCLAIGHGRHVRHRKPQDQRIVGVGLDLLARHTIAMLGEAEVEDIDVRVGLRSHVEREGDGDIVSDVGHDWPQGRIEQYGRLAVVSSKVNPGHF